MDMLRTFFEKTEQDTSVYFQDKKIWACGQKYRAYQGKYPDFFLTFKEVKFNTWEETFSAVRDIFATKSLITKRYVCQFAPHPVPAGRCRRRRLPIRLRTAKSRNQGAAPGPPGYGPGSARPLPKDVSQAATGRGLSRRDRNFARIICRISYLTTVFFTILHRKVLRVSIFSCN